MSSNNRRLTAVGLGVVWLFTFAGVASAASRVKLEPSMVTSEAEHGTPQGIVDEQDKTGDPPGAEMTTAWDIPSQHMKKVLPASAYIDLGEEKNLSTVWVYDTNGKGNLVFSAGKPGEWTEVKTYDCASYKKWVEVPLDVRTRYLRLTKVDGSANFAEIALYAHSDEEFAAIAAKQAADAKAAAEKEAAIAKAKQEEANRPKIDLGAPYGQAILVDEIDVAAADPGHLFAQDPGGASRVETILGKPARVLNKTPDEAAYMTFRVGQYKLLKPGATYLLEIEYPEDTSRSMVILNSGNESSIGFHTGAALGDAFKPKYVSSLTEAIKLPLSGKYETWRMVFNLHDRFSKLEYIRGEKQDRELEPDDGFSVTIAQFSAENIPLSEGAAVSRIRLFEIPDPAKLTAKYTLPPDDLPRRHLFWREEMADNVPTAKEEHLRGVKDPLDWYKFKGNTMQFLGMNTYAKDLLEFGANQHWDSTEYGGNQWVFFSPHNKDLWGQIVKHMGERGFTVLPYYEYSGSKGQKGLGPQRRAKPLGRDDAYTHIKWVESSNADITDPETYEDFKKMLDLTVIKFKDQAKFVGAWLRPRMQMPMGFGDGARKRFAEEANGGKDVSRKELEGDTELLAKYKKWWYGKRQQFLVAMRDYLREKGVNDDALILYTAAAGEPGVGFAERDPVFVTDDVERWSKHFAALPEDDRASKTQVLTPEQVAEKGLYKKALLSEPGTWGGWEWNHASPPPDPQNYKQTEGVLFTHAFNRRYTVLSPETFDAFRGPSGLALARHFSLNENMMFDKDDKPKLGYFAADIERAGPYCMMGEALAMANGDPTHIAYLVGRNYTRGFPQYVRNFNTAFLSLPALPSKRLDNSSSDKDVVVRSISTDKHGTYLAVVNTATTDKANVTVTLPANGKVTDAATGEPIEATGGKVTLTLYPFQLRALRVQ